MMSRNSPDFYGQCGVDRVQELEMILEGMRQDYENELEQAWAEVDRLQLENYYHLERIHNLQSSSEELETRCHQLEGALEAKNNKGSLFLITQSKKNEGNGDDVSEVTEPTFFFPPKSPVVDSSKSSNRKMTKERRFSVGTASTECTNGSDESTIRDSEQRRSWKYMFTGSIHPSEHGESKELMHQLQVLQDAKQVEVAELQLKLVQREAAISTLERTVELREQVVHDLRDELDEVKALLNRDSRLQRSDTHMSGRSLCDVSSSGDPMKGKLKKKKSRRRASSGL